MSLLNLVIAPDPILSVVCNPVDKVDDKLRKFLDDMLETMYEERGAGIAANQLGATKRIMIVDVGKEGDDNVREPHFFINPEIIEYSEEQVVMPDACLSFPGAKINLSRPAMVKVNYLDYHGQKQEMEAAGWLARGVQHEFDHLNGITIVDHVSKLKRSMMMRRVEKIKRNYPNRR